jgi:hypothetical protein
MTLQALVDGFRRLGIWHWFPAKLKQKLSRASGSRPSDYLAISDFTVLEPVDISGIDESASYEFAIDEVRIV